MNYLFDPRLARRLGIISLAVAAFSVVVGVIGLAGCLFPASSLGALAVGSGVVTPNAALAFVLLGLSLGWHVRSGRQAAAWIPRCLATIVMIIGALSLAESWFGWDPGIDQVLFRGSTEAATGVARPELMSPLVSLSLYFLGTVLMFHGKAVGRRQKLVQALAYVAGILSVFGMLDFILQSEVLHAPVAPLTGLTLFALSCGLITLDPDGGVAVLLSSQSLGGVLARRLLPAAIVTPIVLGYLFWSGFQAGLILPWHGIVLMIVLAVASLAGLTASTAFVIRGIEITTAEHRQKSDEALRRSEKYFSTLAERATDVVTVIDAGGAIRYQSPSVERVVGWTPSELIGRNGYSLIHPDDRAGVEKLFNERIADFGATVTTTYRSQHKDGSWRTLESVACNLSNDPDIGGVVLNTRDITERKSLEAQFLQSQKLEAAGQLAGGIAHDFNNILAVIMLHSEAVQSEPGLSKVAQSSLNDILNAVEHASGLVRQLLVFSRREPMQLRPLDLNGVLTDIVKLLRKFLGEQIDLELKVPDKPAVIEADTGMIEQVVMNLCVNARDAMPRGGRLQIQGELVYLDQASVEDHARAGRYAVMTVTDNGHGMDEAVLKRIFEPFFTTKEIGKGSGLGLATVYAIVKQHNGWIEVKSTPGKGTTFRIFFPATNLVTPVSKEARKEAIKGGTETILLVEDELAVRNATADLLRRNGYVVVEATDGISALLKWEVNQGRIDLLLTDMVMPQRMTGLEVAEKLLQRKRNLKVIIWSGYTVDGDWQRVAARKGMVYLAKPVKPAVLLARIREHLDKP